MRNTFLVSCFLALAFFGFWRLFFGEKHGSAGGRGPSIHFDDVMRHTEAIERRGP